MNTLLFILLATMIPIFASTIFIPYWTRRTESFGVSIPNEIYERSDLKAMRKQYVVITSVLSVIAVSVLLLLGSFIGTNENAIGILFGILIAAYMVGSFFVYLKFHRTMRQLKMKENWLKQKSQLVVINTKFRDQKLTFSNLWFLVSFIIAIATMIVTFQHYNQISEKIPMKYNFSGEVTNWADKSYRSVLLMPIMQVYLILLFVFINTVISKAKQQVSAENPEESLQKNMIFRRR